jgi:hypothetical protein
MASARIGGMNNSRDDQDIRPLEDSNSLIFDNIVGDKISDGMGMSFDNDDHPIKQTKCKPKIEKYLQFKSSEDSSVYYRMGIIDFLQKYGKRKKLETWYLKKRNPKEKVEVFSCVPPVLYADRFHDFLKENMFAL